MLSEDIPQGKPEDTEGTEEWLPCCLEWIAEYAESGQAFINGFLNDNWYGQCPVCKRQHHVPLEG